MSTPPVDPDASDPGYVFEDCPECDFSLRIRWPPDDPESVELRCHGCKEMVEIEK